MITYVQLILILFEKYHVSKGTRCQNCMSFKVEDHFIL